MSVLKKLNLITRMKYFDIIKVSLLSLFGISSIELMKFINDLFPVISFVIQTLIGVLTIIYLIFKLIKLWRITKKQ